MNLATPGIHHTRVVPAEGVKNRSSRFPFAFGRETHCKKTNIVNLT